MEQRAWVDAALDAFLPEHAGPRSLLGSMRYSLLAGGKRLRPILCIAACQLTGGTRDMALPTACAIEMVHTMSLIHDDLPAMDNSDYRRGQPTNHKVYGEPVAILAGDALLTFAFELVVTRTSGVSANRLLSVVAELARATGAEGLAGGQVIDLECAGRDSVEIATLNQMHGGKTAALLSASVVSGATLAGADTGTRNRLNRYAQKIGLAFQIIDDILDVTSTDEKLRKSSGKDAHAGKATYATVLGVAESRRCAEDLIAAAKAELSPFGARASALLALADHVVRRDH